MEIKIPATIEAATKELNGLGELLTAKEWHRAAIVYAFTTDGTQGGNTSMVKSDHALTPRAFARLGIVGFRSHNTVGMYRRCWQTAVDDGQAQPVLPGHKIALPTRDFPPTKTGKPEAGLINVIGAIDKNPEAVAEALRDNPHPVAEALLVVDPNGRFEAEMQAVHYGRGGLIEAEPFVLDYDEILRGVVSDAKRLLYAVRDGQWEPGALEKALLHFLTEALAEVAGGNRVPDSLFDEISAHLEAARA